MFLKTRGICTGGCNLFSTQCRGEIEAKSFFLQRRVRRCGGAEHEIKHENTKSLTDDCRRLAQEHHSAAVLFLEKSGAFRALFQRGIPPQAAPIGVRLQAVFALYAMSLHDGIPLPYGESIFFAVGARWSAIFLFLPIGSSIIY